MQVANTYSSLIMIGNSVSAALKKLMNAPHLPSLKPK